MKVLAIGDSHFPFCLKKWLDFIWDVYTKENPDKVIHVGDLTDQYVFSKFQKGVEAERASREMVKAKRGIASLGEMFPRMELIMGNHDERYKKRLSDGGIPINFAKGYREIFDLPIGWNLHEDFYKCDGVFYYHGNFKGGISPALTMAKALGSSVVCGHHHSVGGVDYTSPLGKDLFGLNLGCGVDIKTYGFKYAKENLNRPVLGCGIVIDGKEGIFHKLRGGR